MTYVVKSFLQRVEDVAFKSSMIFFAALIVFGGAQGWDYITTDHTDPIESWGDMTAVNSPIQKGNVLFVSVDRVKARIDCTTFATRVAINIDGQPFPLEEDFWEGGTLGDKTFELPIATERLPVGSYFLRSKLRYDCPNNVTFYHDPPTAPFRVIDGVEEVEQLKMEQRVLKDEINELTRSLKAVTP
tara:strand:+ start:1090 stop:1650 length:561 start_codon:yes stop_codon:yes gene_type:complete